MSQKRMWIQVSVIAVAFAALGLGQESSEEAKRHYRIGLVALEDGDLKIAASNFERAAALAPSNALIRYNLGVVLSKTGDQAGAKKHLEAAIQLGLDEKIRDEAETILAKIDYRLEKTNSLGQQLIEAWTGATDLREVRDYSYIQHTVESVRVVGCRVILRERVRGWDVKGWNRDKEVEWMNSLLVVAIPVDALRKIEARWESERGEFRGVFIHSDNAVIEWQQANGKQGFVPEAHIVTGERTQERILEQLRKLAVACNARLEE